jgi:NAD(P)-dependent dehydrogenase (short-subunit alcohol dehydrogenase family)
MKTAAIREGMKTDMTNQRVLITGAADSVGRVTAETFFRSGAKVHICDVNEKKMSETLREAQGLTGTVGNIAEREDVDRIVAEAEAAMGGVDVLVNFVGIAGPHALLENISDEDWLTCLQVNTTGTFYMMRAVISGMKKRRFGAIVNISTASTRTGIPGRTAYVASKYAVEGMTRNAARELGPYNIRCNAVLPGALKNARMQFIIERVAADRGVSPDEYEREMLRYISMRTRIELQEIAECVLFLCSDKAPHITGQILEVSGGQEWEE